MAKIDGVGVMVMGSDVRFDGILEGVADQEQVARLAGVKDKPDQTGTGTEDFGVVVGSRFLAEIPGQVLLFIYRFQSYLHRDKGCGLESIWKSIYIPLEWPSGYSLCPSSA